MKDFTTELRTTLLDCSMVAGPHYWVAVWMKDYTTELQDDWWTTLLDCRMDEGLGCGIDERLHNWIELWMKDYTTRLQYG